MSSDFDIGYALDALPSSQSNRHFAETQAHAEAMIAQALLGPLYTERRGILYRDDRLVEVRARGRGGARGLAAAIDPPKGSSYAAAAAHSMLVAWPT